MIDSFGALGDLPGEGERLRAFRLPALARRLGCDLGRLPYSLRVLLENLLRHEDGDAVTAGAIERLARWSPGGGPDEVGFHPARVLMPDSSGGPLLVDLAAMRDELAAGGHDPARVAPQIPVDLIVDHSAVAEHAGSADAMARNLAIEFALNGERYALIRWAEQAFAGMRVVPPGNGILHQINIERLAQVVRVGTPGGREDAVDGHPGASARASLVSAGVPGSGAPPIAFPDSLVGMDSHTPMVNALGVFGWGVGGIEAASAMLGQPITLLVPDVVGCRLTGRLRPGVTATDVVLTLTALLRAHDVVGKFVEYCGPGLATLALPDRATIANMAPEYGATMGFFPVDEVTLAYLRGTGRPPALVARVERYARAQRLWRDEEPRYAGVVELDLASVEPVVAGPRKPQERVPLAQVRASFDATFGGREAGGDATTPAAAITATPPAAACVPAAAGSPAERPLRDGDVVIAAITSCTNTSNPTVMLGAGLLARRARARGLRPKPWVKASLSPGSRRVGEYLARAGLVDDLAALGFDIVGYGCMTCMGSSGSLAPAVTRAIGERALAVSAVLSGNRNFEARVHPLVRANYLASPPLVVAYALAGTVRIDLDHEPLGTDGQGRPVFLRELWPADEEIRDLAGTAIDAALFVDGYATLTQGSMQWAVVPRPAGPMFRWDPDSTYIRRPPYVAMARAARSADIVGARAIALLGDGITTDHITPVGSTAPESEVGRYLMAHGVAPAEFNSLSSRRANPEVVVRCTYANVLLRNEMVPGHVGDVTRHQPSGDIVSIFAAGERYRAEGVPLVVVAGRNYGAGSSRDTAAKGVRLLGVRAVIAESFERIHRSNLVGMGVLPLEFPPGLTRRTLGLTGAETFDLVGLGERVRPRSRPRLRIRDTTGATREVELLLRVDTEREAAWSMAGGIMPYVLAGLAGDSGARRA